MTEREREGKRGERENTCTFAVSKKGEGGELMLHKEVYIRKTQHRELLRSSERRGL